MTPRCCSDADADAGIERLTERLVHGYQSLFGRRVIEETVHRACSAVDDVPPGPDRTALVARLSGLLLIERTQLG